MPYIKPYDRPRFNAILDEVAANMPADSGELNYLLTVICKAYVKAHGGAYQQHNDVSGVLFNVAQELYRRDTAPYEDKKIQENGDIIIND